MSDFNVTERIQEINKSISDNEKYILDTQIKLTEARKRLKFYKRIEKEIEDVEREPGQNPSLQGDEAGNKDGQN